MASITLKNISKWFSDNQVIKNIDLNIRDGELELTLNGRNAPEMHVSREYTNMLKGYKAAKEKHASVTFVKKTNLKINYDEVVFKKLKL